MCFIADVQDYNESQVRLSSIPHYGVHKLDDNTVYVVLCCDDELIFFSVFSFGFQLGKFQVVSLPASWHHISSYPHWVGFLLAIKIHMNTTTFEVIAIRVCSFLASFGRSRHEPQV